MRWRDLSPAPGVGPWQGLEVDVMPEDLPPGGPGLRVEAAAPRRLGGAAARRRGAAGRPH